MSNHYTDEYVEELEEEVQQLTCRIVKLVRQATNYKKVIKDGRTCRKVKCAPVLPTNFTWEELRAAIKTAQRGKE